MIDKIRQDIKRTNKYVFRLDIVTIFNHEIFSKNKGFKKFAYWIVQMLIPFSITLAPFLIRKYFIELNINNSLIMYGVILIQIVLCSAVYYLIMHYFIDSYEREISNENILKK